MTTKTPLELYRDHVRDEWIDYNGHMNVAFYVLVFDQATDVFLDYIGLDRAYRDRTKSTTFTAEGHITYDREVMRGDPLRVTTQLLGYDEKRLHHFHTMYHAEKGYIASTCEFLSLHIDAAQRRVGPMGPDIILRAKTLWDDHKQLPRPPQSGRSVSLTAKRASAG
ncbi:MAG: thioesterase family protein [Alphaproteobacteria bacterium]